MGLLFIPSLTRPGTGCALSREGLLGNTGGRCFGTNNGGHISVCLKQHLASDNFLKRLSCALGTAASVKRVKYKVKQIFHKYIVKYCGCFFFSLQSPVRRSPSHTVAHCLQGSAWRQCDRVWAHLRRACKQIVKLLPSAKGSGVWSLGRRH